MTPEEIYAKHHKTATRPNPFLSNDTLRAMEEYAVQQVKAAIEATKAEYGAETTGLIDDYKAIKEDIRRSVVHIDNLLYGNVLSFFADKEGAKNFALYLNEKYNGIRSRTLNRDEIREQKKRRK